MPIAAFKSVREVSSEDPVHVAANLLRENAAKKWKTKSTGEKTAHVILEFEELQQINGIDIGNEHSAFVEVLVSKTGCHLDDFKEILLSSSFMTPIESKNSSNINRVRCFSADALSSTALPDKWKLVKIVCSQPFNKHVAYGLSFIKVHVTASATVAVKPKALVPDKFIMASKTLGSFRLREDSPDSESDGKASLSLFQRWKANRSEDNKPEISTAAAIRDAASPAALRRLSDSRASAVKVSPAPASSKVSTSGPKIETKPLDRNRNSLLFGDDDYDDNDGASENVVKSEAVLDAKKQRLSKHIESDKNRRRMEVEKELEKKKEKKKRSSIDKPTDKSTTAATPVSKESTKPGTERNRKRLSSPTEYGKQQAKKPKANLEKSLRYVPFNELLRGVVLVISGIQNPDRADLRSKAIALGAKYKVDWESGCTHLICAFRNTPKYNQVKGKGKIVTRSWIEKCYELKKYLPWRRYALDTTELGKAESDDELYDISLKPTVDDDNNDVEIIATANATDICDVDDFEDDMQQKYLSGPDTEDELELVKQRKTLNESGKNSSIDSKNKKYDNSMDIYEVSTDEEDYLQQKKMEI